MATRTRKATAKKTPRAPRNTTPKKTPLALSLVKPAPTAVPVTIVDLRHRLPVRRRNFVGPHTQNQIAGARAALASAALQLPIPVSRWNGPTATLTDGTVITHNDRIGHNPTFVPPLDFTVQIACPHGAIHTHTVASAHGLTWARDNTRTCEQRHAHTTTADDGIELDWDKAITRRISPATQPKPSVVLQLTEGVRRAHATKADTQELRLDDIAEGLAVRVADDTAKEHPDHA